MKKVLLNCLPPTSERKPGYSLSVIKPFLVRGGYEVSLKYWNLFLRQVVSAFWFDEMESVKLPWLTKDLMPFFNYMAHHRHDEKALTNIRELLQKYFPDSNLDEHLERAAARLEQTILAELKGMEVWRYDFIYVQSKFYKYELIATGVFCEILKKNYPGATTIVEAQEFPAKAMALMDSFDCYDYATWGEYELPLLALLDALGRDDRDLEEVPNVVYRDSEGIPRLSRRRLKKHLPLDDTPFADFSDYMAQSDVPPSQVVFPLEGGRGCHWNRCSFCYMNDGYVYRRKTPGRMAAEIKHYMDTYGAQFFYFIDNDIVGHNVEDFKATLAEFKKIRQQRTLRFEFGEVIAKEVDADIIRSLGEAGFLEIQIGYESTSDTALRLINKKSRFAHLILASKWSFRYGIEMSPQNILRSMPFETEAIILENIRNLYYLRFLLSHSGFYHWLRELCVVSTSRYFNSLRESGRLQLWDSTPMQEFMVADLIKPLYKYDVFLMQIRQNNPLWGLFKETERFYRQKKYSYEIAWEGEGARYVEYADGQEVGTKRLSREECRILAFCDRRVVSLAELHALWPHTCTIAELDSQVRSLMDRGLIYMSDDGYDFVAIISLP